LTIPEKPLICNSLYPPFIASFSAFAFFLYPKFRMDRNAANHAALACYCHPSPPSTGGGISPPPAESPASSPIISKKLSRFSAALLSSNALHSLQSDSQHARQEQAFFSSTGHE
jgi:hypothetical protein